jgi:hypothetical protein
MAGNGELSPAPVTTGYEFLSQDWLAAVRAIEAWRDEDRARDPWHRDFVGQMVLNICVQGDGPDRAICFDNRDGFMRMEFEAGAAPDGTLTCSEALARSVFCDLAAGDMTSVVMQTASADGVVEFDGDQMKLMRAVRFARVNPLLREKLHAITRCE